MTAQSKAELCVIFISRFFNSPKVDGVQLKYFYHRAYPHMWDNIYRGAKLGKVDLSNNSFKYPMYWQTIPVDTVRCAVFILCSREGLSEGGRKSVLRVQNTWEGGAETAHYVCSASLRLSFLQSAVIVISKVLL